MGSTQTSGIGGVGEGRGAGAALEIVGRRGSAPVAPLVGVYGIRTS